MDRFQRRNLQADAADCLRHAPYSPRRLTLIHVGISSLFSMALFAITFYLNHKIDQTTGLSGLGVSSLLQTAQTILQYANMLLLPFWELGFLWAVMCLGRRQEAAPASLLEGFRKFGPLLRGKVVQFLVLMGAMFVGVYAGFGLFLFSPFYTQLYEAMEPYLLTIPIGDSEAIAEAMAAMSADETVMRAIAFCMPFMLVGAAVAVLPVYYRLRMMDYILLDPPRRGGFYALWKSARMMKGNLRNLLLLDLRFWWFYLLELAIGIVCYGDMILPLLNVELSMSADVALFAFYAVALVLQLGLYVWKKPLVFTTYARFYDYVREAEENAENALKEAE